MEKRGAPRSTPLIHLRLRAASLRRRQFTRAPVYERASFYERAITALKRRENAAGSSIGLPSAISA